MIVYAEEIKLSPESSPRYNLATNKITLGMMALGELRKIWAASSWTFRLFEYIIKNKFVGIETPEISIGGGIGVPGDVATGGHSGHNPLSGAHPIDDGNVVNNHIQVGELAIDPLLTGEGVSAPGNPNPHTSSAIPPTAPLASGHVFWNNGNVDALAPDAAGQAMYSGQHSQMMQPGAGPEGWAGGGVPLGTT